MNGYNIYVRFSFIFVIVFCLCLLSFSFSFGDSSETSEDLASDSYSSIEYVYVDSSDYSEQLDSIDDNLRSLTESTRDSNPVGDFVDINQTRETVSASDTSGFKSVLLGILGDYETVTTDYTYQSSNGYYSHSITTERDWAWICSAAILGSVVWCVFRGVVAILCRA